MARAETTEQPLTPRTEMQLQADRLPKSPGDAATKWRRLRQFFIHAASNRDCKKKSETHFTLTVPVSAALAVFTSFQVSQAADSNRKCSTKTQRVTHAPLTHEKLQRYFEWRLQEDGW